MIDSVRKITIYSKVDPQKQIAVISLGGPRNFREEFSEVTNLLQVSRLNFKNGSKIERHIHNPIQRVTDGTSEIWIVMKGLVTVEIYDTDQASLGVWKLSKGSFLLQNKGGHGIVRTKRRAQLIEVKNGPYRGSNADKFCF
jgi:hypothetical protein